MSIGAIAILCHKKTIALHIEHLWTHLWISHVYFMGIALIGVFFFALQYATQAGWAVGIQRIPETFGYWLWVGGITGLLIFIGGHHSIFHWTHDYLYDVQDIRYDPIIAGKKSYLNLPFFTCRTIIYSILWIGLFVKMRQLSIQADFVKDRIKMYRKIKKYAIIFIICFAITSSTVAWDWILSIDTHWFSTLFGWYVFASWLVAGLSMITFCVTLLKEKGYLTIVNTNHLHDLGKYLFAFSIFWAYLWFSQFLLIYYANIPEETIYFIERMKVSPYRFLFFSNIIINFLFPFLALMKQNAKKYTAFLKIVSCVLLIGHWLDFYLMISPSLLKETGAINTLSLGIPIIYFVAFLHLFFKQLAKKPIIPIQHPLLQESKYYHN